MTIAQVNAAAREAGLTYGQYVSLYLPETNIKPVSRVECKDGRKKIIFEDVVSLLKDGMSIDEMATRLGVTDSAVRKYIKRTGLNRAIVM